MSDLSNWWCVTVFLRRGFPSRILFIWRRVDIHRCALCNGRIREGGLITVFKSKASLLLQTKGIWFQFFWGRGRFGWDLEEKSLGHTRSVVLAWIQLCFSSICNTFTGTGCSRLSLCSRKRHDCRGKHRGKLLRGDESVRNEMRHWGKLDENLKTYLIKVNNVFQDTSIFRD